MVSVPHPYEQEKKGVKCVTSFEVILDSGMLVEGTGGVFPVLAQKPNGEEFTGYALLAPTAKHDLPMTPACDILARVFFEVCRNTLEDAKVLVFNRDGGFAYNLAGTELPSPGPKKIDGVVYYDPKQFDEDPVFRKLYFETYGWTLAESQRFWQRYFTELNLNFNGSIFEVKVGSGDWNDYKTEVMKSLPKAYKMPMGEYRIGYLLEDEFRREATELSDTSTGKRLFKQVGLPLGAIGASFTPIGAAVSGVNFVAQVSGAAIDDKWWQTYHARANTVRHDLAPALRLVERSCKNKIKH